MNCPESVPSSKQLPSFGGIACHLGGYAAAFPVKSQGKGAKHAVRMEVHPESLQG
jgi:hypothetical protein